MKAWLLASLLAISLVPTVGLARQRGIESTGQVVHSRRAPVIMHRAVPPFRGVHVYEGRQSRQTSPRVDAMPAYPSSYGWIW